MIKLSTIVVIAFAYFVLPATAIGVATMIVVSLLMIISEIIGNSKEQ